MKSIFFYCLLIAVACLACIQTALAQGLTFTTNTYSVGGGPQIAIADINDDGRLDLITANYNTNTLTILTNNGNGSFGFYATLTVGPNPGYVIAADLSGNGKLDLVTANNGANTLTVLTNNGSNLFGSNATITVGNSPQCVVATDINGDGKLDLICANLTNPGTLTVLTNNGSGVFGSNATITVGKHPVNIATADVNGDGKIDLITANSGANTLTVLTNNGNGGFGFNATQNVGKEPNWIITADVNGDGKPDLICANVGTNTLTVLTNNGSGIFGLNATLTVGGIPFCVVAADLNGDGKLDLISGNGGSYPNGTGKTLTVLTNNGNGILSSNATLTVGNAPYWIATADLNADGKSDLIAANFNDNTVTVLMNTSLIPPPTNFPVPTLKRQGANIRVSWPSGSPGWSLQQTSDLTRTNWLPSGYDGYPVVYVGGTVPITDDGTNKSFTFPIAEENLFFHLLHP